MCLECRTVCKISVVVILGCEINDEAYQAGNEESAQNAELYAKTGCMRKRSSEMRVENMAISRPQDVLRM